ncbi:MAG: HAD family hydrolase [Propioniciclava sp.]
MSIRFAAAALPLPSVTVCRELVSRGKPAPDAFLSAAELLSVHPSRTLVVEDAAAGIDAVRSAGMAGLAVLTTTAVGKLPADRVVRGLDDVTWHVGTDGIALS